MSYGIGYRILNMHMVQWSLKGWSIALVYPNTLSILTLISLFAKMLYIYIYIMCKLSKEKIVKGQFFKNI